MTNALAAARQHLLALAEGKVAPRDKPSAFHHGLICELVATVEKQQRELLHAHTQIVDLCRRNRRFLQWQLNGSNVVEEVQG